ncbi:Phosphoenolpyruvate carboxylase, archaeal [Methanosarcina sp. WWM596]|nr:Phosphoenolpyruvate carboxylase, archaeal [Methanosarcina sp. WWM596]
MISKIPFLFNIFSLFLSGACFKEVRKDIEVLRDTFTLKPGPNLHTASCLR